MGRILEIPSSLTPLAELAILDGRVPTSKEWKTWVIESPALFNLGHLFGDVGANFVQVPTGFMTDFASIPWLFRWWQTGSTGPQRVAGYFHDWLYSEQSAFSRKQSDIIFREVMKAASNKKLRNIFRRWAMYLALRVGGFMAWRSNQKSLKKYGHGWRSMSNDNPTLNLT